MNDRIHDLIEKSSRGDLNAKESVELQAVLRNDAELNQIHEDALAARAIFERAPRPTCPDELRDRILRAVDKDIASQRTVRASRRIRPQSMWAWSAAAVAAAIVLAIVLPGRLQLIQHETQPQLTEAEIEEVRADVELAFSLISDAMTRSSRIVDRELRQNVTRPIFDHIGGPPTPAVPSTDDNRQSWLDLPPRSDC